MLAMAEAGGDAHTGASTSGPRAMVHVRVDREALLRGHTEGGEVCEVPGVGPIPVATARMWAGDAVLKALVTNGVDVVSVAHAGRSVTAAQRAALEERDPICVVPGCTVSKGLEIDHVDGWALTRTTTLERLARLCRWHHHLKTYCGYRLEGRAGNWQMVAPDHPPADGSEGSGPSSWGWSRHRPDRAPPPVPRSPSPPNRQTAEPRAPGSRDLSCSGGEVS